MACLPVGALAQSQPKATPSQQDAANQANAQKAQKKASKVALMAARKKACRSYNGRLIGYYGKIYHVRGCKRYAVAKGDISKMIRRHGGVRTVESDVVKVIPLHVPKPKTRLTCREAEGRVFLTLSGQLFQVAGCRRYVFPDWETFLEYRRKGRLGKKARGAFVEVEDHLAQTLPEARVYPSVLDTDNDSFLRDNDAYDIIPAKRACKGIEGRYVTYYSQVYKIERCKKRPVLITTDRIGSLKVRELTSSQWLSIPEGKPLNKK